MKKKTEHTVRCEEVAKIICERLDEQLNSRKCKAIRKHLETCVDCSRELENMKKVVALYRREAVPRLTPSIEKRLFSVLNLDR
ncbi:MAG TPA: zf-HC2 domain-containing protein [Bacteroidota bacterium]|nr:zf-HC2 domain-containing protein [Bacteroidota bacterium]